MILTIVRAADMIQKPLLTKVVNWINFHDKLAIKNQEACPDTKWYNENFMYMPAQYPKINRVCACQTLRQIPRIY